MFLNSVDRSRAWIGCHTQHPAHSEMTKLSNIYNCFLTSMIKNGLEGMKDVLSSLLWVTRAFPLGPLAKIYPSPSKEARVYYWFVFLSLVAHRKQNADWVILCPVTGVLSLFARRRRSCLALTLAWDRLRRTSIYQPSHKAGCGRPLCRANSPKLRIHGWSTLPNESLPVGLGSSSFLSAGRIFDISREPGSDLPGSNGLPLAHFDLFI